MSANFIASALLNHLSRAAVEESKTYAGSRTIAYTRASKRLFVICTLIGTFAFSMAVSSMPEEGRMELACILGVILLLPIAIGGAEVFLTRIMFDDMHIHTSAPWRGSRRIPWTAVTECVVGEAEYYVTLRTRGDGDIKMNTFMRGIGELMDQTMHRIYKQADASESDVGIQMGAGKAPALAITVIGYHESLAKLVGGMMMVLGLALMLYSAFMTGTKPSDYATISGELTEFHRTAFNDAKQLNLWLREPAVGPLLPGLVRPERNFILHDYPDVFPERDFFQSARKGLSITLTVLAADAARIKTPGSPMSLGVGVAALEMDGREYYSLTQYLAAQKHFRFLLMFFGTCALIGGAIIWVFRRRKLIY